MKEKYKNYRSVSAFLRDGNVFETHDTINDEQEAEKCAAFFNTNKNMFTNLFANYNVNTSVSDLLNREIKNDNSVLNLIKSKEYKNKKSSLNKNIECNLNSLKNDNSFVKKEWIKNFCWACSLNLLDEILEEEIYKEKKINYVYDIIRDENTYFDTSSFISVPYEFTRFILSQMESNELKTIKINNMIKEEKYLFKKFYKNRKNNNKCNINKCKTCDDTSNSDSSSVSYSSSTDKNNNDTNDDNLSKNYNNYSHIREKLFNYHNSNKKQKYIYNDYDLFYNKDLSLEKNLNNLKKSNDESLLNKERKKNQIHKTAKNKKLYKKNRQEKGKHNILYNKMSMSDDNNYEYSQIYKRTNQDNEHVCEYKNCAKSILSYNRNSKSGMLKMDSKNYHKKKNINCNSNAFFNTTNIKHLNKKRHTDRFQYYLNDIEENNSYKYLQRNKRIIKRSKSICSILRTNDDKNNNTQNDKEDLEGKKKEIDMGIFDSGKNFNNPIDRNIHSEDIVEHMINNEKYDIKNNYNKRIYYKYINNLNYIKEFYYIAETKKKKPFPLFLYNNIKLIDIVKQCPKCYCFFNKLACHCIGCKKKYNMKYMKPHYFIFQHGLTASVWDFQNIINPLLRKYPPIYIYVAYSYQGHTFEGVDVGTERICSELTYLFRTINNDDINISMIGHSLGGVLNRYNLVNLYRNKILKKKKFINFITFASPHIGVHENIPFIKTLSAFLGSHTVDDLNNKSNALLKIGNIEGVNMLKKFENIIFYGNTHSDWLVGIRTSLVLPYTIFNNELLSYIMNKAQKLPDVPLNIFSIVHLYMREKKLLFFHFYQNINNPNYLLNKRKNQSRFLYKMLQNILSSTKLLGSQQKKRVSIYIDDYESYENNNKTTKNIEYIYSSSSCKKDIYGNKIPFFTKEKNNNKLSLNQNNLLFNDDLELLSENMSIESLSDSLKSDNNKDRYNLENSIEIIQFNYNKKKTKNANSSVVEDEKVSSIKSISLEDVFPCDNNEESNFINMKVSKNSIDNSYPHIKNEEIHIKNNTYKIITSNYVEESEKRELLTTDLNKYMDYRNTESENISYSNNISDKISNKKNEELYDNREPKNSDTISGNIEDGNKKKETMKNYKYFEKLFFQCLKERILYDIKTLDDNFKKESKPTKKKSETGKMLLQNTINIIKNYSFLNYSKNNDYTSISNINNNTLDICDEIRSFKSGTNFEDNNISINEDQSDKTNFEKNNKGIDQSSLSNNNHNEEYNYISEFFHTSSDDNCEGNEDNSNTMSNKYISPNIVENNKAHKTELKDMENSEWRHRDTDWNNNESINNIIKKKNPKNNLLKGITKDDKIKYKKILRHIYSISNEELIENFFKNPDLIYFEVALYCLYELPIQRYCISMPPYPNAHVQIIAHPRICPKESTIINHLIERLIL
ncbi:serine esterase, putative [Plasmodium vinckei vinckei]|uniref:Serine esterase, putative n=1 Tax=Plasmodium vinckei vinckei TaxID=54757 RepID=A0A449BSG4_PLAVN|nr:serine esterase, putative [Plasmodium vinckei vinckei]VEV56333.1 serine esterase, putative [Plasmodium vinckei vinckei]